MKRGLRIHNQSYSRQVHEAELLSQGEFIWLVYNFLSPFLSVFYISRLGLYSHSPPLLFPFNPFIPLPILRLPSPRHLPPAGSLLLPPLGGYRHLRPCPILSYEVAAWSVLPPSAAEGITPSFSTFNCYFYSHVRGTSSFISMSISSLILSHGLPAGMNLDSDISLQVVDGIGWGNLQQISRHGHPFFGAGIEESHAQFSLCQYRHPS